jgi:hypothetical protein
MDSIRSRWLGRWIAAVGVSVLAAGCGDNPSAPTPATPEPELASATDALAFWQVSSGGAHTCGVTTAGRALGAGDGGHARPDGLAVLRHRLDHGLRNGLPAPAGGAVRLVNQVVADDARLVASLTGGVDDIL